MSLNLIPDQQINFTRRQELLAWTQNIIWFFLAVILALTIWIKINELRLAGQMDQLESVTSQSELSSKIRNLNQQLTTADQMLSQKINWSQILSQLNAVNADGINLINLSLDKNLKLIIITGLADGRQNLLDYQRGLEQVRFIKNLQLPVENLLKKTNLDFQITAQIDL